MTASATCALCAVLCSPGVCRADTAGCVAGARKASHAVARVCDGPDRIGFRPHVEGARLRKGSALAQGGRGGSNLGGDSSRAWRPTNGVSRGAGAARTSIAAPTDFG